MADVEVRCSQCDAVIRISEFADVSRSSCQHCGGSLIKPQGLIASSNKHSLHLAPHKVDHSETRTQAAGEWNFNKTMELSKDLRQESEKRPKVSHHFLSWLLFFLLGGTMYLIRYQYILPPDIFQLIQDNAFYVVLALYIFITIRAYADTIFQGILCTVIPLYPFYYIFMVTDNFYLRAIVGGLLVGLGEDSFKDGIVYAKAGFDYASAFIASGGGDIGTPDGWHRQNRVH